MVSGRTGQREASYPVWLWMNGFSLCELSLWCELDAGGDALSNRVVRKTLRACIGWGHRSYHSVHHLCGFPLCHRTVQYGGGGHLLSQDPDIFYLTARSLEPQGLLCSGILETHKEHAHNLGLFHGEPGTKELNQSVCLLCFCFYFFKQLPEALLNNYSIVGHSHSKSDHKNLHSSFHRIYLFLFYLSGFHVCSTHRRQERAQDHLELE